MKKEKAMRHISRIDQYKKHQHGWWVRIHRDNEMIHRFFSDYAHHSSEGRALSEAKKYRDALLLLYPKPERGNMFNKPNSRNKGNPPGVHKTRSLKRGRAYSVWQAGYILPNGQHINRKFHFSPDGRSEKEAKALAIEARNEGLKLIEKIMREKTEQRRTAKTAKKATKKTAKKTTKKATKKATKKTTTAAVKKATAAAVKKTIKATTKKSGRGRAKKKAVQRRR